MRVQSGEHLFLPYLDKFELNRAISIFLFFSQSTRLHNFAPASLCYICHIHNNVMDNKLRDIITGLRYQPRCGSSMLTENFRYVRVMHVWTGLQDLPTLVFGPHHERVHRSLDMWLVLTLPFLLPHHFSCGERERETGR